MPEGLAGLPRTEIPLLGWNLVGLDALRSMFKQEHQRQESGARPVSLPSIGAGLSGLVDEIAKSDHGLVMVMGKGGVGKTTVAAAVAVALAQRGVPVHLTTTDPAQHIPETLQSELAGLRVSYIDPKQEVREYRQRTLDVARPKLSPEKLSLLQEELQSPCYEEVAVFQGCRSKWVSLRGKCLVASAGCFTEACSVESKSGATCSASGRISKRRRLRAPEPAQAGFLADELADPFFDAGCFQGPDGQFSSSGR